MPPVKSATTKIMNSHSRIGTLMDNLKPTTTATTIPINIDIIFKIYTLHWSSNCKMKLYFIAF